MLSACISLSYVAGNDILLEFAVTDEEDVVADISDFTVSFVVARDGAVALSTNESTAIALVTDGTEGLFTVSVNATDTEDLLGTYPFQAQLQDELGELTTVARGFITFTQNLLLL
jgi:hypothetical protein